MSSVIVQKVWNLYERSMDESDKMTSTWALMSSPWPVLCLVMFYILAVVLGPRLMKTRDAFDIKRILIIYNLFLVILSIYMMYEFISSVVGIPNFNYFCQGVESGKHPNLLRHAAVNWLFFISKMIEFFDTVFLIVTKKSVSFLHAYHHTSVCVLCWIVVKWQPGGATYFGATYNCFVHTVMYSYYMLSALGPQFKKYLWWKRYLTTLQLIQFSKVFIYLINALTVPNCSYPRWLLWLYIGYDISLIILFVNFYIQEYIKQKNRKIKNLKSQ